MTLQVLQPKLATSSYLTNYLALHLEGDDDDEALATLFTPKAMRWAPHYWLLDLTSCRRYWLTQASWRRLSSNQLLHDLLAAFANGRAYRGVLADHPWKAVLLVEYMRERQLTGLVNQCEPWGSALYKQASWTAWLAAALHYAGACRAHKLRGFSEAVFRRQLEQLHVAMERLAQASPAAMSEATASAMRRRYGQHVALLWEWTHAKDSRRHGRHQQLEMFPDTEDAFALGFPWTPWQSAVKPLVKRHLDFPMWQWDHIDPLLTEDFDRLCDADGWSPDESVVKLQWTLNFDDGSSLVLDLAFRYPHRLHAERRHHKTARLQASYIFQAKYRQMAGEDEVFASPKPIIGWTWELTDKIRPTPLAAGLFGDLSGEDQESGRGLRIENQLPVPVERFGLAADWVPEDSFAARGSFASANALEKPWLAIAKKRPLYIYRQPIQLDAGHKHRRHLFVERTAIKWWCEADGPSVERDYFILEDSAGRRRWGYKDQNDRWCLHGIFA